MAERSPKGGMARLQAHLLLRPDAARWPGQSGGHRLPARMPLVPGLRSLQLRDGARGFRRAVARGDAPLRGRRVARWTPGGPGAVYRAARGLAARAPLAEGLASTTRRGDPGSKREVGLTPNSLLNQDSNFRTRAPRPEVLSLQTDELEPTCRLRIAARTTQQRFV